MEMIEWLELNARRFQGIVITGKGKSKQPIDKKVGGWLYDEVNTPEARLKLAIEKYKDGYGIGVLLPNDICVVDLDNKPHSDSDGVARWKEISDIPFDYLSTSGKGAHLWVKNPLGYPFVSSYAAVSGFKSDKAVELFAGENKFIKLPDGNGFDWSAIDLDNLPDVPEDFFKGVPEKKPIKVSDIDHSEPISKLELPSLLALFVAVDTYEDMPHRADLFPFIAMLKSLSDYQRYHHGNTHLADRIKALCLWRAARDGATDRYPPEKIWDTLEYRGADGYGFHSVNRKARHNLADLSELYVVHYKTKLKEFKATLK